MDPLARYILRGQHSCYGWPSLPDAMPAGEVEKECQRRAKELGINLDVEEPEALLSYWVRSGGIENF